MIALDLNSGGFLFIGADGVLYHAEYDPEDWLSANGWQVAEIRREWWGRAFPGDGDEKHEVQY